MPTGTRPQPPVGTCKVAFKQTFSTSANVVNTFWLRLTSAGSPAQADLDNITSSLSTAFATHPYDQLSSALTLTETDLTWIYATGQAFSSVHTSASTAAAGTAVADASCSHVVDWLISRYYRGGHPRTYLAGVPVSQVINGQQLSSTQRSAVAASCATFLAAVNALSHGDITKVELGTVSFANGKVWRSPPIFEPYTGVKVRQFLGSQRRRIGGR